MPEMRYGTQYLVSEWGYTSVVAREDPYNTTEVDVIFRHESNQSWRVPAYWAGRNEWRVRFAPPLPGRYSYTTDCTDEEDSSLHALLGMLTVQPYTGDNPALVHGPLQIASSQRVLAFADGTPFFWLGDTWWFALSGRCAWPEDFQMVTADRKAKGFNVAQVVAGLFPDMAPFDPRAANEGGYAWEANFERINPGFFDMADLRIQWMVRSGIIPCIVGSWGYHLPMLGAKRMKQHWRYMIARWGSYPVVWCLAGELAMPYYLDEKFGTGDDPDLAEAWVEIGHYVREVEPYGRLLTLHPSSNNPGRDQVTDDRFLDFEMLQPGHDGYQSVQTMLKNLHTQRNRMPIMPVLVDEINYEAQGQNSHEEVQRLAFWAAILSGSAGFTYGANGLWSFISEAQPWGKSPHGITWADMPWLESIKLPGAEQLGHAKRLLELYEWWRFESHQDWVLPAGDHTNYAAPFAAGIPREVRIIYSLLPSWPWDKNRKIVTGLEADVTYQAFFWDPRKGRKHDACVVAPDAEGRWMIPLEPTLQDWVIVLEKTT
ncbi:MAG: hypothetical protein OHK0046_51680 [Anaerolineae bacterium]